MSAATWAEVRARRLARSSLTDRATREGLVELARNLGGVHAQVQASAEIQLGARLDGIRHTDVQEALWSRRSLVKAWTLRGTLHLHPADELPLWYAARRAVGASPVDPAGLEAWRDPQGVLHSALGSADVKATRAAVWDALDGRCLLRQELAEEVVKRVGPHVRQRLLSGFAFFLAELCQGPPQGAKVTFVRPDQWISGWHDVDERTALFEVCRRYLRTYGPARPGDFREWFSSPAFKPVDARVLFDSLADELDEIDVDGRSAYVLTGDNAFPAAKPSLRLLPEYDVYIMGSRERDHLIPEAVRLQVAARGRGRYDGPAGVSFILIDGVTAGLWRRTKRGRRIELHVSPLRRLTRPQRADLDAEAERIGVLVGREPVLTVLPAATTGRRPSRP